MSWHPRDPKAGEAHPNARLRDAEVARMLELRALGAPLSELAAKFGVNKSCVAKIARGERRGGVWAVATGVDPVPIRRRCFDPLPPVPPLQPGEDAGSRALRLIAHALKPTGSSP